mmetsp:Transcript_37232/g.63965  ORF Transcript_37232/g.63965 Transcript_37232/m.63965 type:complete len:272 (-) Transcript_37232:111-926(-)
MPCTAPTTMHGAPTLAAAAATGAVRQIGESTCSAQQRSSRSASSGACALRERCCRSALEGTGRFSKVHAAQSALRSCLLSPASTFAVGTQGARAAHSAAGPGRSSEAGTEPLASAAEAGAEADGVAVGATAPRRGTASAAPCGSMHGSLDAGLRQARCSVLVKSWLPYTNSTSPRGTLSRSQCSCGTASLLTPRSSLDAEAMSPATRTMARAIASAPILSTRIGSTCSQKWVCVSVSTCQSARQTTGRPSLKKGSCSPKPWATCTTGALTR